MYESSFTVTGTGAFPADMLRKDECFPADMDSAARIGQFFAQVPGFDSKAREVNLIHRGDWKQWTPNIARWNSFGWRVVPESIK